MWTCSIYIYICICWYKQITNNKNPRYVHKNKNKFLYGCPLHRTHIVLSFLCSLTFMDDMHKNSSNVRQMSKHVAKLELCHKMCIIFIYMFVCVCVCACVRAWWLIKLALIFRRQSSLDYSSLSQILMIGTIHYCLYKTTKQSPNRARWVQPRF